jgi:type IV secretion system protein TrbE
LLSWLMDHAGGQAKGNIDYFLEHSTALFAQLAHSFRHVEILGGDKLASYLSASVTYEPRPVRFPAGVIRCGLATREWHMGERLRIDERCLATIEVRNFGSPHPMTVEPLHELPFECRWVTTIHGLDHDARSREIKDASKWWMVRQKGIFGIVLEGVFKIPAKKSRESELALDELNEMQARLKKEPFALATCNVHVWGATAQEADQRAAQVVTLMRDAGLEARTATLNNAFAPLADMPGAVGKEVANLRRSRELVPAITRLAPVTGVSSGSRDDWRFGGPALLVGQTRRGVPLFFSLNAHGSDSAHTAIIGKTGAGKSSLLAFMAAQFLRYPDAKVIVFDRKRSFMTTCLALGGDWVELGGGGHGVQPLRAIDRPEELAWAHAWVVKALQVQGLAMQPHTDAAIADALGHLAECPPDERTLTRLHTLLSGDQDARQALRGYLKGSSYGDLFDGVVASYGDRPVVGIETQDIVGLEQVAPLVISAVFRAVRRDRLIGDGAKLVIIDEAWSLLRHPLFADEIESWAREMRKLKTALVLATQSLADLADGKMKVIFDQLGNRFYLPHAEAMRPQSRELYERVGLLEEQVRILAGAQPKGEYLLQSEELTRLVEIRLEDDALALCAASSPLDHARAFDLLKRGVEPGDDFTRAWLAETTSEWRDARAGEFELEELAA